MQPPFNAFRMDGVAVKLALCQQELDFMQEPALHRNGYSANLYRSLSTSPCGEAL